MIKKKIEEKIKVERVILLDKLREIIINYIVLGISFIDLLNDSKYTFLNFWFFLSYISNNIVVVFLAIISFYRLSDFLKNSRYHPSTDLSKSNR